MNSVVVIGQGYVGLPMAIQAAEAGHTVVGFDTSIAAVEGINAGHSHIGDVSDDRLKGALALGYRASADPGCLADADVVIVCVPTPLSPDGGPDLGAVESAADVVGANIRRDSLVILESTTYPGTTEEVFAPRVLTDRFVLDEDVRIAFSPERIDPGNQTHGVKNTPKVVGGMTPRAGAEARDFYATFIDTIVEAKGAREAEMAKVLENTFRHVNIALVNEMVRFSNELDIDLWDAIRCASTKPFGFMPFWPGPGVGGHCIPVDPSYLSHRVRAKLGYSFRMVELAEEINKAAPFYVAQRAIELLNDAGKAVKGSVITLLGITYKPDIADQRETPALHVAERLDAWGATVQYHDPFVPEWTLTLNGRSVDLHSVEEVYNAAAQSDITILLQAHSAYDLDRLAHVSQCVLDTRNKLPRTASVHVL